MAATKLTIYNDALQIVGETPLASLTEARPSRYHLDQVWASDEIKCCLEDGQWRFARRTQMLDYDTTVTPSFGYRRAFSKSSDWVTTVAVCQDEYFNSPLLAYKDEAGYIYTDLDVIYVTFVSSDTSFGMDMSKWTNKFADYVAAAFAAKIVLSVTGDKERMQMVYKLKDKRLVEAKNVDAQGDPTSFPPPGSWVVSRRGRTFRDRGSRINLIG